MGKRRRKRDGVFRHPGLKRFSQGKINTGPNRMVIAEYHGRVDSIAQEEELPITLGDPRLEVKARIKELRKEDLQREFRAVVLERSKNHWVRLYFRNNTFFLVKNSRGEVRRSVEYEGRDRIMDRWHRGVIQWSRVMTIEEFLVSIELSDR